MKCVIVVDNTLPTGILANTAAALGLSLGNHIQGLIGPDITDKDGGLHKGITAVPIPILATDSAHIHRIYQESRNNSADMTVIGFSALAQSCHHYSDYQARLSETPAEALTYTGICLYGPRKAVNSLCGQLKLLR